MIKHLDRNIQAGIIPQKLANKILFRTKDNSRVEKIYWEGNSLSNSQESWVDQLASLLDGLRDSIDEYITLAKVLPYNSLEKVTGDLLFARKGNIWLGDSDWFFAPFSIISVHFVSLSGLGLATLVCWAYAGLHLGAWNSQFPTHAEEIAWKGCCFFLCGCLPGMKFASGCIDRLGKRSGSVILFLHFLLVILFILTPLYLFVLCRLFLVVESFISLRHLPIGVFWSPAWVQTIFHF